MKTFTASLYDALRGGYVPRHGLHPTRKHVSWIATRCVTDYEFTSRCKRRLGQMSWQRLIAVAVTHA